MIDPKSVFQFHLLEKNSNENYYLWIWDIPVNLPYFEGHFFNQPILPAVAIIDANLELLRIINSKEVVLSQIISSKFLEPVTPKARITIVIQKKINGSWSFEWRNLDKEPNLDLLNQMDLFVDFSIASAAKK